MENGFNRFRLAQRDKAVETAPSFANATTGLKPGVNERRMRQPSNERSTALPACSFIGNGEIICASACGLDEVFERFLSLPPIIRGDFVAGFHSFKRFFRIAAREVARE